MSSRPPALGVVELGGYVDAYDEVTLTRLGRAVRTYDPDGVMAIGQVLMT